MDSSALRPAPEPRSSGSKTLDGPNIFLTKKLKGFVLIKPYIAGHETFHPTLASLHPNKMRKTHFIKTTFFCGFTIYRTHFCVVFFLSSQHPPSKEHLTRFSFLSLRRRSLTRLSVPLPVTQAKGERKPIGHWMI